MVNGELSSVNYGPKFRAPMKLSFRFTLSLAKGTLQLQQFR